MMFHAGMKSAVHGSWHLALSQSEKKQSEFELYGL
jgi:hypothetical protein